MLIVSSLFYFIQKLSETGNMNIYSTKGATGEVYIPIPPEKKGSGKVTVKVQNSIKQLDAMTEEKEKISTGTLVKVKDILNGDILIVERVD